MFSIIDGDGVTDDGSPVTLEPVGTEVRYGRLLVDDAYGPQTDDLIVRVRAETFDGSGFIDNPDDYCTIIATAGAVSLSNWQDNLVTGETSVTDSSGLLAGSGEIVLGALGAAMTQMIVTQSLQTTDAWLSSQALYAAESGVQYAAYHLNRTSPAACSLSVSDSNVGSNSWFSISTQPVTLGTTDVCQITANGKAGSSAVAPAVQRQIVVTYRRAGL